jgi:hypothetical protein
MVRVLACFIVLAISSPTLAEDASPPPMKEKAAKFGLEKEKIEAMRSKRKKESNAPGTERREAPR